MLHQNTTSFAFLRHGQFLHDPAPWRHRYLNQLFISLVFSHNKTNLITPYKNKSISCENKRTKKTKFKTKEEYDIEEVITKALWKF